MASALHGFDPVPPQRPGLAPDTVPSPRVVGGFPGSKAAAGGVNGLLPVELAASATGTVSGERKKTALTVATATRETRRRTPPTSERRPGRNRRSRWGSWSGSGLTIFASDPGGCPPPPVRGSGVVSDPGPALPALRTSAS